MRSKPPHHRRGFTLVELVTAMVLASLLIAGMTSALFITLSANSGDLPASKTLEGLGVLSDMMAELQYGVTITEQTATAVTVTVPDRDADLLDETIRFAWSGTVGDPLTRQYNGGTVANVVEDVHDFDLQYRQPAAEVVYTTVRLQVSSNSLCSVQTAIPLVNQP